MEGKKKDMLNEIAKDIADQIDRLEEQYDRLDDQGRCDYLLLKKSKTCESAKISKA